MHGLGVAFIVGSLNALELIRLDPEHFNIFEGGWKKVLDLFLINGLLSARLYLTKAPTPGSSWGTDNDLGV